MQILHFHWQPSKSIAVAGKFIVWLENPSRAEKQPEIDLDSAAILPYPLMALPPRLTQFLIKSGLSSGIRRKEGTTMRLPTVEGKAIPLEAWSAASPESSRKWLVEGLSISDFDGFNVLLSILMDSNLPSMMTLGLDSVYWLAAADLLYHYLYAGKLSKSDNKWQPDRSDPEIERQLSRLQKAMPPLCLAEVRYRSKANEAGAHLDSFLRVMSGGMAQALYFDDGWLGAVKRKLMRRALPDYSSVPGAVGLKKVEFHFLKRSALWEDENRNPVARKYYLALQLEAPQEASSSPKARDWRLRFALQSRQDPSLIIPAEKIWQDEGDWLNWLHHQAEQRRQFLAARLRFVSRLFPPLQFALKSERPTFLKLTAAEAHHFLRRLLPILEARDITIFTPPWWQKKATPVRARLSLAPAGEKQFGAKTLLDFRWQAALGETVLSREEFEELVALKKPLVQRQGAWVELGAEQVEAALRFWESQPETGAMSLMEALRLSLNHGPSNSRLPFDGVDYEGWLADWMRRFQGDEAMSLIPSPLQLQGDLRPYQQYGYAWLDWMRRWGLGACLADDMGLGKTVQILSALLKEKEEEGKLPGPTLIVCPTSVAANWQREVSRFTPALKALLHQGSKRLRGESLIKGAGESDLVITSYTLARLDADTLRKIDWFGIVADEAQNIKNPHAKRTQAIRSLNSRFRVALTGTPIENRLSELWSILHFLNPGYLGTLKGFQGDFIAPIERRGDEEAAERLRQITAPFILRRVKSDPTVIQDLPEKNEMKVYCGLTPEQTSLYQAVVDQSLRAVEGSEGIKRKGIVLSTLLKLKQICNHPAQFLSEAGAEKKRGAQAEINRSGKLARLVAMLEETQSVGDRGLIFTQYAQMGRLLQRYLSEKLETEVLFLFGGTPVYKRSKMIARFQEEEDGPSIFILSLKAGGTGLNLTRANHVFHYDRWWNPAVENQATDRAFRIGQRRDVQVHKFICAGTLEESIDEMIERKKGLAEKVVGSGENWLTELSAADLRQLIALRRLDG